jgi:hypothetical protein
MTPAARALRSAGGDVEKQSNEKGTERTAHGRVMAPPPCPRKNKLEQMLYSLERWAASRVIRCATVCDHRQYLKKT